MSYSTKILITNVLSQCPCRLYFYLGCIRMVWQEDKLFPVSTICSLEMTRWEGIIICIIEFFTTYIEKNNYCTKMSIPPFTVTSSSAVEPRPAKLRAATLMRNTPFSALNLSWLLKSGATDSNLTGIHWSSSHSSVSESRMWTWKLNS